MFVDISHIGLVSSQRVNLKEMVIKMVIFL